MLFLHINRTLCDCLYCIGMKNDVMFMGYFPNFLNWLNSSNFIVRKHNGDKKRVFRNRILEILRINNPILIDGKIFNLESLGFKMSAGLKDSWMFYCRGN